MKPRPLTSPKNPRIKQARRLRRRRHRERQGLFLVEGPHLVAAALEAGDVLREVFCTEEFLERHAEVAERLGAAAVAVWAVPPEVLDGVAATENPQGVVAVAVAPRDAAGATLGARGLALALEGVGDPANVGAALRAARAAGARLVVLGPGCCDRFNSKAVRASAGALFAVPAVATDRLVEALEALRAQGARVVVAAPRASRPCWAADLAGAVVLVVGSEAHGVSAAVEAVADERVGIPMPGGGESLNAAVAAGVLLYEAVRQRAAAEG